MGFEPFGATITSRGRKIIFTVKGWVRDQCNGVVGCGRTVIYFSVYLSGNIGLGGSRFGATIKMVPCAGHVAVAHV